MNTTVKLQPCVVRVDKHIADSIRKSFELKLGVPVSISTAVNKALRDYISPPDDFVPVKRQ